MVTHPNPTAGIIWMVLTGFNFIAVTAIVKHLGDAVPAAQAAFLRYVLGLVFLLPMIRPMLAQKISRKQWQVFGLRGVAHSLGVILWFYAMTRITIAEVTAMNYLNPVYVTIAAALLLGEALPPRRLFAVIAALVGAVIVLRPGFRELDIGHLAMVFTAILFAISYLTAKMMSDEVPATVVVGMLSIMVPFGVAPFAYAVWVPVGWAALGWLFLVAFFATAGHYTMTRAFAAAPLTVTQPVTFLQLVWATILGVVVFDEPFDGWVILGAVVIVASVTFIAWREAVARRENADLRVID